MAAIDLSTFLLRGQSYTVRFSIKSLTVTSSDVLTDIQAIPYASQVGIPYFSIFAERMDAAFIYAGDGSDVLANFVQNVIDLVSGNHFLTSVDFINAESSYEQASGGIFAPGSTGQQLATSLTPTTSTLVLIVIGLGLVVFLASGGASIVRRVAA